MYVKYNNEYGINCVDNIHMLFQIVKLITYSLQFMNIYFSNKFQISAIESHTRSMLISKPEVLRPANQGMLIISRVVVNLLRTELYNKLFAYNFIAS